MNVYLTDELITLLHHKGINTLWSAGATTLPLQCQFEPPCSIKWMSIHHSCTLGAFSYGVSGFYFAANIGRYVSIAQNVQIGRGDHPTDWLSTSPIQYLDRDEFFACGFDFTEGEAYQKHQRFSSTLSRAPHAIKPIMIGHDVWIGIGAYIKPGVNVGNGAIIAGHAVVTKDVQPYSIVAGNPARIKKMRFCDTRIARLEQLAWWQYAIWSLKDIAFDNIDKALDQLEERQTLGLLTPYQPTRVDLTALCAASNISVNKV
ncbi:MAG: CatB-related O-acetyltransferase [Methylovulum sp.]|jgi:acetyltransferase-like isoleucine patch superfamily enzyme